MGALERTGVVPAATTPMNETKFETNDDVSIMKIRDV
jgi:hypothetical protein